MRPQKGHWNSLKTTTVTLGAPPPLAGESPRGTRYSSRATGRAAGAAVGAGSGSAARLSQATAAAAKIRIRALLFMLPSIREQEHAGSGTVSGGRCYDLGPEFNSSLDMKSW